MADMSFIFRQYKDINKTSLFAKFFPYTGENADALPKARCSLFHSCFPKFMQLATN